MSFTSVLLYTIVILSPLSNTRLLHLPSLPTHIISSQLPTSPLTQDGHSTSTAIAHPNPSHSQTTDPPTNKQDGHDKPAVSGHVEPQWLFYHEHSTKTQYLIKIGSPEADTYFEQRGRWSHQERNAYFVANAHKVREVPTLFSNAQHQCKDRKSNS